MATIAEERRKRMLTETDLKEAEGQIVAEQGLCDREKMEHTATRLKMEENTEVGGKEGRGLRVSGL
jgi:hypothetical protein